MGTVTQSKRQLAWVFDLNKCIGCQTCSVACKVLWNDGDEGTAHQWWMTVNTAPGRGTPRSLSSRTVSMPCSPDAADTMRYSAR